MAVCVCCVSCNQTVGMEERPAGGSVLLQQRKPKLIDILSADPDFVLQHADSRFLLTMEKYRRIKAMVDPSEKICELLDCVIQNGEAASWRLLKMLRGRQMQETFPMLVFLKNLCLPPREFKKAKRRQEFEADIPIKKPHVHREELVTDRQLMMLARGVGRSWRQMGVMALGISGIQLDQLEEDNHGHVERVFAMLRIWRMREGRRATAVHLHGLLSQGDYALPVESLDVLLMPS